MTDIEQEARAEANSGPGWYEVIHPTTATTEIVRVMEDGSIYCPEGVLTREEFAFAAARGKAHLLVRADEAEQRVAPATREAVARVVSQAVGGWNPETRAITNVADALLAAFDIRERSE